MRTLRNYLRASTLLLALAGAPQARAEVNELRIGKQYGLPYLQLVVMEDRKLIEKHAQSAKRRGVFRVVDRCGGAEAVSHARN